MIDSFLTMSQIIKLLIDLSFVSSKVSAYYVINISEGTDAEGRGGI